METLYLCNRQVCSNPNIKTDGCPNLLCRHTANKEHAKHIDGKFKTLGGIYAVQYEKEEDLK